MSTNNIFGNTGSNTSPNAGIFGSGSNIFSQIANKGTGVSTAQPSAATSLFGGTSTAPAPGGSSSTAAPQGNIFGSFGAPSSNTVPSATHNIFGGTPTTTPTVPASMPSPFGAAPAFGGTPSTEKPQPKSIFGQPLGASAGATTEAPKSFFNLPPSSAAASTSAPTLVPATTSNIFSVAGRNPAEKPAASTNNSIPSAPSLAASNAFPAFGSSKSATSATPANNPFGGTTPAASTEKKANPIAIPAFFGGATGDPTAEKRDTTAAAQPLFGAAPAASNAKNDTAAPASNVSGGLFSKPAAPGASLPVFGTKPAETKRDNLTASTSVNPSLSVPLPSVMRGKTIEEIVNRWTADLESRVKEFNQFAGEVAVWDRALIENGNNLNAIYSHVLNAEKEQAEIDQSLDHIEQQQRDLLATLDAYERSAEDIMGGQGGSLRALDTGPADTERDKNYALATDLHTHLDDLSGSLTQMIESVNKLTPTDEGDDAMAQIAQILAGHLESLQWVGGAVQEIESKVQDTEKGLRDAGLGSNASPTKSRR